MAENNNTPNQERIDKAKEWLTSDAYRAGTEHPKVNLDGASVDSATFVKKRTDKLDKLTDGPHHFFGINVSKAVAKDEYKEKADKVREGEKNIRNYGGKKMDEAVNYFLSGGKKDNE